MGVPYRQDRGVRSMEAPVRQGTLRLEEAPRHINLALGELISVTVHDQFLTWIDRRAESKSKKRWWRRDRKPKKRSIKLDGGRLLIARAFQVEELSIWFEERDGVYRRLLGVEPVALLDAPALEAWRDLERLARRLASTLAEFAGGATQAIEFGRGQHRVLLVQYEDCIEILARPVFKERQRVVFRGHRDGTVENLKGKGQGGVCTSRYSVTVGGDRIRFDQADGERAAELHLPWVSPQDRAEIARRFRELVDGADARRRPETEQDSAEAPPTMRDPGFQSA